MWTREAGQALIELALGIPLFILGALFALALLDATATQQALQAAIMRSAVVLVGSNDDAQARGAAETSGWLLGQSVGESFAPAGTTLRCTGQLVTLTVSAPGHLGFLLPLPRSWSATTSGVIETDGPQQAACAARP